MTDHETSEVVRHEEELQLRTRPVDAGAVRIRKEVESEAFSDDVPYDIEQADFERTGPLENDSGEIETLPDGSISVPVFEEELVVTKRLFVRERVVVRKTTTTERRRVETELRRERVEVDLDEEAE
jgi:uncharacterized protein (TIGR02271 family)